MALELLFLGTGTSAGVPMIGCHCAVCTSSDPRDQRSRPSVLVRYPAPAEAPGGPGVDAAASASADDAGETIRQLLIDTTPELRVQCLREGIDRIDGVLYTHAHADHIFGLDDLRRFNAVMNCAVDVYAEPAVLKRLGEMFVYIFKPEGNVNRSFIAKLAPRPIEAGQSFDLFTARWTPLRLMHGRLPIVGFRVDHDGASLAYCTDVSGIGPETYPMLANLDVLVLDALRYRHHPTHFTVDQALAQIEQIQPGRAFLTHMAHDISHADLSAKLPAGVELGYDGLVVSCS